MMMRMSVGTLLSALILLGGSAFGTEVNIGINIGSPPPPRVIYAAPLCPGPEFVWIEGYWYPVKKKYRWHEGYWTPLPYVGARWVAPRYDGGRYYGGYWMGNHGRFEHDHHWDNDRNRDQAWNRDRGNNGKHKGHGHDHD